MPSEKDGIMIILSSPSGAGKTTLVKKLSEKDKYDILKKTMIKLDVSIEDQKEIMQHLSKLKRMNIEK